MALSSLLHLCDSAFPTGSFGYSDGLEAASDARALCDGDGLSAWLDVCLDEAIGRCDGPAVWQAWSAFHEGRWDRLAQLDEELQALRPAAASRRSSRAMGRRLIVTWQALHPSPSVAHVVSLADARAVAPTLPIAFACAAASVDVSREQTVEAYAYTRLAATTSAAMRLLAIGQTDAHRRLARALDRLPAIMSHLAAHSPEPSSFMPAMDMAAMAQQHVRSRLFRS